MAKLKKYSVIGFYADNKQPYGDLVESSDPMEAAQQAYRNTDSPRDLMIVDVIAGHQETGLNNHKILSREDLRKMKPSRGRKKIYTVIGFYPENDQPYSGSFDGAGPREAALQAPASLMIVDVIPGEHDSILGNEVVLDRDSVENS